MIRTIGKKKYQKSLKNPVSIRRRPHTSQSFPAKRWVLFQFSSLFKVQGILMPTV